ncbi:hypothetical protein [Halorarum halobium]|uniref:hypothetical protein n=1 Tax=Halorarum halobium TaxID=3075121 RepID=UPI0028AB3A4F|nr:hypothetical protein [Halobaculum sp. XH14]
MQSELPAMLAFAGGSVSIASATALGVVAGVALVALSTTFAVASLSRLLGE